MSNKETIEEAAERIFPTEWTGSMSMPTREQLCNKYRQEGFIEAAKIMYSEEEVKDMLFAVLNEEKENCCVTNTTDSIVRRVLKQQNNEQ